MLRPIIENVFVNLVGDGEHIELHAQVANQLQFRPRENLSRGIVGRVYDDGLGVLLKRSAQLALIKRPLTGRFLRRPQFDEPRLGRA